LVRPRPLAIGTSTQNFIERANIADFKTRLQTEADPAVRAMLILRLAEEEEKHAIRVASTKGF
jgi:hypothetical protein